MNKAKDIFLTILRNKETTQAEFRQATDNLSNILAHEALAHIQTKSVSIRTPKGEAEGTAIVCPITIVPILRSGITMLPAFLTYFEHAPIGIVGLQRDEKTAQARLYYQNFPPLTSNNWILILDPMIATGGTGVETIRLLKEQQIPENQIVFVSIISATEGITKIQNNFPNITIITAAQDKELDKHKFIVPGLGDFGNRFFGTKD